MKTSSNTSSTPLKQDSDAGVLRTQPRSFRHHRAGTNGGPQVGRGPRDRDLGLNLTEPELPGYPQVNRLGENHTH